MNIIQYRYSSVAWGPHVNELYVFHLEEKVYMHYDHGVCDVRFQLPDDLVETIRDYFEPIYREFPSDKNAFDAPTWTLTIDDKTCTGIAVEDWDPAYARIARFFNIFKNIKNK